MMCQHVELTLTSCAFSACMPTLQLFGYIIYSKLSGLVPVSSWNVLRLLLWLLLNVAPAVFGRLGQSAMVFPAEHSVYSVYSCNGPESSRCKVWLHTGYSCTDFSSGPSLVSHSFNHASAAYDARSFSSAIALRYSISAKNRFLQAAALRFVSWAAC